jgi:predicted ATPase
MPYLQSLANNPGYFTIRLTAPGADFSKLRPVTLPSLILLRSAYGVFKLIYLQSLRTKPTDKLESGFPFDVPVIESLDELHFTTPVTFFVGENGSGKSTLLEAIACGLKCPTIGSSDVNLDDSLKGQRSLAASLRFARKKSPRLKLFFRAEDAIGFTHRVTDELEELKNLESHFDESLSGYGRQLATGAMRGQRNALKDRYGENPDARSHGEWFINVIQERIHPGGFYLLDEPETPLSPIHQLSLLSILKDSVENGSQFVIATHSPILMALPGASIYSFDHTPIQPIAWDEVEHVSITRAFLNDPESYLRHL